VCCFKVCARPGRRTSAQVPDARCRCVPGKLRRLAPEFLKAGGRHHDERPRQRRSPIRIAVGYVSRTKYIITGARLENAIADLKRTLAFENKPSLILAFVNVQRNAGGRLVLRFRSRRSLLRFARRQPEMRANRHAHEFLASELRKKSRDADTCRVHVTLPANLTHRCAS